MENTTDGVLSNKIKWAFSALIIIVTWFSLVLQFSISVPAFMATGHSLLSSLIQLFSYFTILSNLLMALCLIVILLFPKSAAGRFFTKAAVLTGITLYMTIVALIYNLLLRSIWHPEGLFRLADELLHVLNPLLFIIYWIAFVSKQALKYRDVWQWLWFPFFYFIYVLIRGAVSGRYPYPFLDVSKSGYLQVVLNALILLPLIWALGAFFVLAGRSIAKNK